MGRKVDTEHLVGAGEIADLLGIHRQSVHKLRVRHADFPEPVAALQQGFVWVWSDVEAWCRKTGRLK